MTSLKPLIVFGFLLMLAAAVTSTTKETEKTSVVGEGGGEHGRRLIVAGLIEARIAGKAAIAKVLEIMGSKFWKNMIDGKTTGQTTNEVIKKIVHDGCVDWNQRCCGVSVANDTSQLSCTVMCQACPIARNFYCAPSDLTGFLTQTCSQWNAINANWTNCAQIQYQGCSASNGSTTVSTQNLAPIP